MIEIQQVLEGTRRSYVGHGDSRELLKQLPDNSIDCVITDPPAGIGFMGKAFDSDRGGRDKWISWLTEILAECYRVTKPGGRMLCWSIPRTMHWTGMAIENAGWHIENVVAHLFGSGFPKAKTQLKPAREDWWLARKPSKSVPSLNVDACRLVTRDNLNGGAYSGDLRQRTEYAPSDRSATATLSRLNRGAGQFVQPSGRWPANLVLTHSSECRCVGTKRVASDGHHPASRGRGSDVAGATGHKGQKGLAERFAGDADGKETVTAYECAPGCPVAELDRQSGTVKGATSNGKRSGTGYGAGFGEQAQAPGFGDTGGASRFFHTFEVDPDDVATAEFIYAAKASRADREAGCEGLSSVHPVYINVDGVNTNTKVRTQEQQVSGVKRDLVKNNHPTVKSRKLMSHLVKLIAPCQGIVLDAFAGSGSTGVAAILEGRRFIGFELSNTEDEPYVSIARQRIADAEQKTTISF